MIELSGGPLLRGTCNRCGACCVVERDGAAFTCTHLVREGPIGEPMASFCDAYFARTHLMPITLVSPDGRAVHGNCMANGTEEETLSIIRNGIGRGCSLEVVT